MDRCDEKCARLPSRPEDWVADLGVTRAWLNPDQRYRGSCILVLREHRVEVLDLPPGDRDTLWKDIEHAAEAIRAEVAPDKLNLALLGNMVPHQHAHVIARRIGDGTWPGAIWSADLPAVELEAGEKQALVSALRERLKRTP
jgi:diadenosine tetraphosphate (Ap4A) HIT family hydrolase